MTLKLGHDLPRYTFALWLVAILDFVPKEGKRVEKFEPYDFRVIWSLMMQYSPLTQFGQTNIAKLHLSLHYCQQRHPFVSIFRRPKNASRVHIQCIWYHRSWSWLTRLMGCWLFSAKPWWRHQMETFSALLTLFQGNPPATGGFPSQGPVTRSFDVFFDLRLHMDKRLSKQWRRRWFETPSRSSWRQCNAKTWTNGLSDVSSHGIAS